MRRAIFLLVSISVITLSGCKKDNGGDMIWDISPVVMMISVADAQGHDLLDPQATHALDLNKIKAVYKGEDYVCNQNEVKSKACLPRFFGLKSEKNDYFGIYLLYFGELNGAKSYTNESVTLVWPDGSSDDISFNRDFRWKSNGEPAAKEEWFLNSFKVPEKLIKIIK